MFGKKNIDLSVMSMLILCIGSFKWNGLIENNYIVN